jgi:hypothetical protein
MSSPQIAELKQKFSQLNKREQWLVFLIVVMILYAVVDFGIIQFIDARIEVVQTEINAINNERTTLSRNINQMAVMNDAEKEKLAALANQKEGYVALLSSADKEIRLLSQGFIVPEDTKNLLDALTRETSKRSQLVSIENMAAESMQEASPMDVASDDKLIYKHGIRLVTMGKYWSNSELVRAIETLPWRLQVSRVEIESLEFPLTKMSLELYALGRSSVWMAAQTAAVEH